MKKLLIPVLVSILFSCKQDKNNYAAFLSPEEGQRVNLGQTVTLQLNLEAGSFDSIQYLVDTAVLASKTDNAPVSLPTANLALGARLLTARIYKDGNPEEITSNITVLPATAPARYGYKVVNTFPHDTSSYTQGLEYQDGIFYESDGLEGESSLRKVEVTTGKVIRQVDMPAYIFAEGITLVGDRLLMLTWKNGVGHVYDKSSFVKLKEFPYQESQEGWGLCFDGQTVWKSDGSNRLYKLHKDTYQEQGYIEVYDTNGPVDQLNELEYIDGKIYANVYQTDKIVMIDPKTGTVEGMIDLAGLLPDADRVEGTTDVLNGIAWDKADRRLFVTGKKWNKLFEIRLSQEALAKR